MCVFYWPSPLTDSKVMLTIYGSVIPFSEEILYICDWYVNN
jgi:hypothetical protein